MQNILIVEDHDDAMARMKQIVSEAFDNPNIVSATTIGMGRQLIQKEFFDLAVLDLALPDGNGEDLALEIHSQFPNTYIVISTIHDESERLLTALQNGARGFLLKEQPKDHLVQEFEGILQGKPPLAPAITRRLMELVKAKDSDPYPTLEKVLQPDQVDKETEINDTDLSESMRLTDREKDILKLIAKGLDRAEIADVSSISQHTVSTHVSNIYSKLNIRNRAEATRIAYLMGLT